jgi:methionyl-tRNA formyltransferase
VILDAPKLGCLNVHGSLLPKWRGAAPIQRSIWAGDAETGVTIMQMDEGLDTGAMLLKRALPIQTDETSASLYQKLATTGPQALIETLQTLSELTPEVQDETLATYAHKLSKQEAKVDWRMDAAQIERNIRSFNPWPVAFFSVHDNNVKVHSADVVLSSNSDLVPGTIIKADKTGILVATGTNQLLLKTLQLPGKKPISAADVLNGRADWFTVGEVLI